MFTNELLDHRKDLSAIGDITGLYILHNQTRDLITSDKARLLSRVRRLSFLGRGNKDVFADYKYGDSFGVRIVPLERSGYSNLKDFKRAAVQAFEAAGDLYGRG